MSHVQVPKKSRFPRFRLPVPADLQDRVGKKEITESLGTTDPDEALAKATQLKLEWKQRFRDMRAAKQVEDLQRAPDLVRDFLKQLADRRFGDLDGAIYGLQKAIALRLLTSWGPEEFYGRGANRAIAFDPDPSTWEGWQSDTDQLSDIISEAERDGLIERRDAGHFSSSTGEIALMSAWSEPRRTSRLRNSAVGASGPATWAPLAFAEAGATPTDALPPCLRLLWGFDPADPLVPGERSDGLPCDQCFRMNF